MSEYWERVRRENPEILKLLETIRQQLSPQAGETLTLGIVDPGAYNEEQWDNTAYLSLQTKDRVLGIFPRTRYTHIVDIELGLKGGAYGRRDLHALISDEAARVVVAKQLIRFAEENRLTGVYLENGRQDGLYTRGTGEGFTLFYVRTETPDGNSLKSPPRRSYTARRALGFA